MGEYFFELRGEIDTEWVFTDGSYVRAHHRFDPVSIYRIKLDFSHFPIQCPFALSTPNTSCKIFEKNSGFFLIYSNPFAVRRRVDAVWVWHIGKRAVSNRRAILFIPQCFIFGTITGDVFVL